MIVEMFKGVVLKIYYNDYLCLECLVVCILSEEIGCVVCGCVVNFKWIKGVMCYGYKGVFEMVVMFDYFFVFFVIIWVVGDYYFD